MKLVKVVLSLLVFAITKTTLLAQQGVVAAGGSGTGASGTIEYSVGQIDYMAYTVDSSAVNQGLQQPYEVYIVASIPFITNAFNVQLFPNPATHYAQLTLNGINPQGLQYALYDMQGKLILQQKLTNERTDIPLTGLSPATYFIRVMDNNTLIKSFKLIKNN